MAEDSSSQVNLLINSPKAMLGTDPSTGTIVSIDESNSDVQPILIDDRTMVPARFIAESMGAEVGWNGDTQEVTVSTDQHKVVIVIDQTTYTVDGEQKEMDVPAQIVNDRTLVPLRVVSEGLGYHVYWFGDNQLVQVGGDQMTEEQAQAIEKALWPDGVLGKVRVSSDFSITNRAGVYTQADPNVWYYYTSKRPEPHNTGSYVVIINGEKFQVDFIFILEEIPR